MERLELAHAKSIRHRNEIENSELCGCFYCMAIFSPSHIISWCDTYADEVGGPQYGHTAICPNCSVDSVIGSASGYTITIEFLEQMNRRWF